MKSRLEIIYSIAITAVIPALLVFNTIYLAMNIRSDYNEELQTRSELANSILATSAAEDVKQGDANALQDLIDRVAETQKEVRDISFIVKDTEGYQVLASANEKRTTSVSEVLQLDIVYTRKWPVARSIEITAENGTKARVWNVATPVIQNDKVIGIVSSNYLTSDVDEKFDATLSRSYLILLVSTIAVIVLLLNHFRLIGDANLLRKQKEVNQTMSDFLSVATHELKAPMSIIKGYIANVTDGTFGEVSPEIKEQLAVASSQTDRLNELVQDLLNVSRIEQGRIQFSITKVDISKIIQTIIATYNPVAQQKGLQINYESNGQVWVNVDAGRMQEIMTNLIDNAVKYSLQGSVIIRHEQRGKMLITSVRDTGIGMTSEERSRLFQRFYRVRNDKTKDISGTGLGLWIIKQYIEKMGGKIEVDSLVGSGTEFRVSLPLATPPAETAS